MSSKRAIAVEPIRRLRLEIRGVVQGVGFRPHVYAGARRFGLKGFVGNESAGVFIEAEGRAESLAAFEKYLRENLPPLAHISSIARREIDVRDDADFRIVESAAHAGDFTLVSPDIATCADCRREFFDAGDRRYHYPFINCTNCGPRFTITEDVPYDRALTTMRVFEMCAACRAEYEDPADRRFHAQPNACPECGPHVWMLDREGRRYERAAAFDALRAALKAGAIAAVKGVGGFHLACDARNEAAVEKLRERKGRVDKPFAVMCRDLAAAERLAAIDDAERAILTGKERPIVLLRKKTSDLSARVAPGNRFLGVMLPYAPLHHLLFDDALDALVMTSGNLSQEPIVKDNAEAREKLAALADSFLLHDRDIFVPCDDSVVRVLATERTENHREKDGNITGVVGSAELPVRRSRGYTPFPVALPFEAPPVFAVGGELKATFCLTRERFAFMSQHLGDMENLATLGAFEKSYAQMKAIFRVEPDVVACDLHPQYLSTRWAERNFAGRKSLVKVQHHHAHVASVMAENGVAAGESVLGFAFDGTGYGTDGAVWGGEVLLAGYADFTRAAALRYFPLAGGDAAVKNVYRLALALLREAGVDWREEFACVRFCPETEKGVLRKQLEKNLNTAPTSSFGRLFDAVASLAGVRHRASYEAQAAIEFESLIDERSVETYRFDLNDGERLEIDYRPLIRQIAADVLRRTPAPLIAAKFHNAVAGLVLELSRRLRARFGRRPIALSGGCWQNAALLKKTLALLRANDFEALAHRRVPPNDGGLALGQAAVAAFRVLK